MLLRVEVLIAALEDEGAAIDSCRTPFVERVISLPKLCLALLALQQFLILDYFLSVIWVLVRVHRFKGSWSLVRVLYCNVVRN